MIQLPNSSKCKANNYTKNNFYDINATEEEFMSDQESIKAWDKLKEHKSFWKNVEWTSWSLQRIQWQPNGPQYRVQVLKGIL